MKISSVISNLSRWVSKVFTLREQQAITRQSARHHHRDEISDEVWNAFWVIGHGGPVPKSQPPSFRN